MNWKRQIPILLAVFLLVGLLAGRPGGCAPSGKGVRPADARVVELKVVGRPRPDEHLSQLSFTIRAELAETPQKRLQGLAGRSALEPGHGMLYVYARPQTPTFSWQQTRFPLSVAFMRADGTILDIHLARANDQTVFAPREPVSYVLEVRQGWFRERGVQPGDRFEIPPALAPPLAGPAPRAPEAGQPADTAVR